ncbi:hypothetical protein C0993_004103 [Termitomyces sp. T159_Od127]|nr:hypothetical protein C0993_004103 [Termitomyces sp. T159_Od127]
MNSEHDSGLLKTMSIMALAVQFYFIRRIYKLSMTIPREMKLELVFGLIALLTLLAMGEIVMDNQLLFSETSDINVAARALSMVVDIGIAAVMVYLIKRKSYFTRTKRMISRLMIVIVGSGSFTAVLSVITLVLTVVYPHSEQFYMFDAPVGSIYLSTLLANLNTRQFVRGPDDANMVSSKDTIVRVQLQTDNRQPQSPKLVGDIEIQNPTSLA